jgi:hypothetical protein
MTGGRLFAWTQSVSTIIIVFNYILRLIFITLAEFIGFKTKSAKEDFVKSTVFYSSFFYTGLQSFFATLSFREMSDMGMETDGSGIYTDFNSYWFVDIGYIMVYNMAFNVFWPLMEFAMYYTIRHIYRMCD